MRASVNTLGAESKNVENRRNEYLKNKKITTLLAALTLTAGGFAATSASAEKYTIQPGDTLYKISEQYNTTVDSLKEMNQITSDLIFANDTLEVSSNGDVYIIEQGDTLFDIALANDVSVEQLQTWNGLSSDLIYAGDTISISGPLANQATPVTNVTPTSANGVQPTSQQNVVSQAPSNVAKTMTVEATAYTAYCTGCSGTTANGTDLRANPNLKVIAVDPRIIPLGTKVWVEGYGEAIAADTGGAIKGNKIDVFIPSKEDAYEWGRKNVTIKILN